MSGGRWAALAAVVLVGVLVLAVRQALRPADAELRASIEDTLLVTYAAHLRAGDTEEAWACCTTEAYRAEASEIVFMAGQARNRDELGPLVDLRLADEPVEHHTEPGRGAFVRAVVWWEGQEASARVVFDVTEQDGSWRLDRTWSWPEDGLGTPRVW